MAPIQPPGTGAADRTVTYRRHCWIAAKGLAVRNPFAPNERNRLGKATAWRRVNSRLGVPNADLRELRQMSRTAAGRRSRGQTSSGARVVIISGSPLMDLCLRSKFLGNLLRLARINVFFACSYVNGAQQGHALAVDGLASVVGRRRPAAWWRVAGVYPLPLSWWSKSPRNRRRFVAPSPRMSRCLRNAAPAKPHPSERQEWLWRDSQPRQRSAM